MAKDSFSLFFLYFLVVYGRCIPIPIDPDSKTLQSVLGKTKEALEDLVLGQTGVNILAEAKEVQ
jgi:hypothetical protein